MFRTTTSFLKPPYDAGSDLISPGFAVTLLIVFAAVMVGLGLSTLDIDPAFGIATLSRALYVDEGFYSDAAQNFVKFGQWGLTFDSRHWPGAPVITVLQTTVFSIFGVSATAARLISMIFAVLSLFSLYGIARTKLPTHISLLLAMTAVLSISFASHSRAAIADPVATGFSLMAIWAYVRLSNRNLSIILSIGFAYLAFCSKMYYLFALITILGLWLMELVIVPLFERRKIELKHVFLVLIVFSLCIASYLALRIRFDDAFAQFMHINSNKTPTLDLLVLLKQFFFSIEHLPFNSKLHVFLLGLLVAAGGYLVTGVMRLNFRQFVDDGYAWGRAGWGLTGFTLLGLATVAALNLPDKAHYHYHAVLPIVALSVFALYAIAPVRYKTKLCILVMVLHLGFQGVFYSQWLSRTNLTQIEDANQQIINLIEQGNSDEQIPVIGQYSAQLGLYSDRIISLETKWVSKQALCQRLEHWKPEFFINFDYPRRVISEGDLLIKCEILKDFDRVILIPSSVEMGDDLILYRIIYQD